MTRRTADCDAVQEGADGTYYTAPSTVMTHRMKTCIELSLEPSALALGMEGPPGRPSRWPMLAPRPPEPPGGAARVGRADAQAGEMRACPRPFGDVPRRTHECDAAVRRHLAEFLGRCEERAGPLLAFAKGGARRLRGLRGLRARLRADLLPQLRRRAASAVLLHVARMLPLVHGPADARGAPRRPRPRRRRRAILAGYHSPVADHHPRGPAVAELRWLAAGCPPRELTFLCPRSMS